MTKHRLMRQLETPYHIRWSLWDESEKMIDPAEQASHELIEATNEIESTRMALVHAYQKLGGNIRDL